MSSLPPDSLVDSDTLPSIIKQPLELFSKMVDNVFASAGALFDDQDVFRAVVISNPKTIEIDEYAALGYGMAGAQVDSSFKKFKVRIARKAGNPHATLQDPCDITKAADLCHQNALVASHTTVATHKHYGINIGSFIEIRLEKNQNKTFNLQTAHFVRTLELNETGKDILDAKVCDSVKAYFKYAESYEAPPAIGVSSRIRELADKYDATDIPGKNVRLVDDPKFGSQLSYITKLKKPFDMWAKAFIYLAHHQKGIKIQITSGARSEEEQERMHQEYKAGLRKLPAACGTCSRHTTGFAIDINYFDPNGNFINSSFGPEVWMNERTGVVDIGTSLGLEWGGTYTAYDPVHFEYSPTEWGDDADQYAEQSMHNNRNLDTIYQGTTTKEQREMDDYAEGRNQSVTDEGAAEDINYWHDLESHRQSGEEQWEEYSIESSIEDDE